MSKWRRHMFANSTDDKIPALMLEFIYALLHLGFHVYNRSGCDPLSIPPRPTSNMVIRAPTTPAKLVIYTWHWQYNRQQLLC